MVSRQDSSHLFPIVQNIGVQSKLVVQAVALGTGDTRGLWKISDT